MGLCLSEEKVLRISRPQLSYITSRNSKLAAVETSIWTSDVEMQRRRASQLSESVKPAVEIMLSEKKVLKDCVNDFQSSRQ